MTEEDKVRISSPSESRQTDFSIPEHEVLLSFLDDIGAEMFREWWNEHGLDAYGKWVYSEEGEEAFQAINL